MFKIKDIYFNFFSKLLFAQQQNWLYFEMIIDKKGFGGLQSLIKLLIKEGVILHIEQTGLGGGVKVLFFMNVYKYQTSVKFFPIKKKRNSAVFRIPYRQLALYDTLGGRATLILQTPKGLQTHKESILNKLGGEVLGVIS